MRTKKTGDEDDEYKEKKKREREKNSSSLPEASRFIIVIGSKYIIKNKNKNKIEAIANISQY